MLVRLSLYSVLQFYNICRTHMDEFPEDEFPVDRKSEA